MILEKVYAGKPGKIAEINANFEAIKNRINAGFSRTDFRQHMSPADGASSWNRLTSDGEFRGDSTVVDPHVVYPVDNGAYDGWVYVGGSPLAAEATLAAAGLVDFHANPDAINPDVATGQGVYVLSTQYGGVYKRLKLKGSVFVGAAEAGVTAENITVEVFLLHGSIANFPVCTGDETSMVGKATVVCRFGEATSFDEIVLTIADDTSGLKDYDLLYIGFAVSDQDLNYCGTTVYAKAACWGDTDA